jgi:hypothetical protein
LQVSAAGKSCDRLENKNLQKFLRQKFGGQIDILEEASIYAGYSLLSASFKE